MKIYHVTGMKKPSSKTAYFCKEEIYAGFEKFFGHVITIRDNRSERDFAHLFSPEGTRVHHLDYRTFKALAAELEHVYIGLAEEDFHDTIENIKRADKYQLVAFRSLLNQEIRERKGE